MSILLQFARQKGRIDLKHLFEEKIQVKKGLEDTWYYFVNFGNAEKWMPGVTDIHTPLDALPLRVGSVLEMTLNGSKQRLEIKAFEAEKKIVLQTVIGHFFTQYTYAFEEAEEETVVTLEVGTEAFGVVTKLISFMIRKMIRQRDADQLVSFKDAIENKIL